MATDDGARQILSTPGEIVGLALSTLAIGIALYVLAPVAGQPAGYRVAVTGAALVVWCYCDGLLGQLHWGLASLEGLLRLKLALAWAAFLLKAFPDGG